MNYDEVKGVVLIYVRYKHSMDEAQPQLYRAKQPSHVPMEVGAFTRRTVSFVEHSGIRKTIVGKASRLTKKQRRKGGKGQGKKGDYKGTGKGKQEKGKGKGKGERKRNMILRRKSVKKARTGVGRRLRCLGR